MEINKISSEISKNPLLFGAIFFLIGAVIVYTFLQGTTPKYACATYTNSENDQSCHKYRVKPLPLKHIKKVSNSACPYNPPSNCP